jgi:hypothetical protein
MHPAEQALAVALREPLRANLGRWIRYACYRAGEPIELQALNVRFGNSERTYYAHATSVGAAVSLLEKAGTEYECPGLYIIGNPVNPAVATRAHVDEWHAMGFKGVGTSDNEIARRVHLFADIDAIRPKGTSATAEQVAATAGVGVRVYNRLSAILEGDDALGYGHSGNGRSVFIALADLPTETSLPIVRGILAALNLLERTPATEIDCSVSDAKRLVPAWGTTKRKGSPGIQTHPHRRTAFTCSRNVRRVALRELETVLSTLREDLDAEGRAAVDKAMGVKPKASTQPRDPRASDSGTAWERANDVDPIAVAEWLGCMSDGRATCPGCGESDAGVAVLDHGFKCSHRRCSAKGRNGFRSNVDLVMEVKHLSNVQAVNELAERFGFEPLSSSKTTDKAASDSVFRIWSPQEIWAPLPPPDYLVDGLLVRGALMLIVAYGASLKTWLLQDGALSTAVGVPWLHRFACKKGDALIVDFEAGDYELRRRAHLIAHGRQFEIPIEGFAFVSMPRYSLASEEFFEALRPLAERYAFIGIDSLSAGSAGIDENDARFASSLYRLKAIASETGCVIVVLHHSKKLGEAKDTDEREMVRGTSAIFNAADVLCVLFRSKDEGSFVCKQIKSRGGKPVSPFVVRVDDLDEGGVIVSAHDPSPEADSELETASKLDATKGKVIRILGSCHDLTSASEIARRVRGAKKTVLEAVKELQERGLIVKHEGAFRLASEVSS